MRRTIILRRLLPFLTVGILTILFLSQVFQGQPWQRPLRAIGLWRKEGPTAEQIASGENILPDLRKSHDQYSFHETGIENLSPFPRGRTKPAGSNYTKCLVVAKMKREDTSWIETELGDMMDSGVLSTAVYTVDDRKAKLHPPKNKGHEVVVRAREFRASQA